MKGVLFNVVEDVVTDVLSEDAWDDAVDRSGASGAYTSLGNYDDAVDSCKLSLNTLNPNEHALIVAQALNLMGVIHYNTSRYDEAISYYEQSAFLREREGDVNALSASYNNLALAYQTKGEYDKALEAFEQSDHKGFLGSFPEKATYSTQ